MNFSELVTRNENMSFKDVLPVLLPIYMNAHNWNIEDSVNTVYKRKIEYILDQILIAGIESKAIDGEVVYDYEYDEFDKPIISCPEPFLITSRSYVNIKSLIKYVTSDIKDYSIIPDELLSIINHKSNNKFATATRDKADPGINKELAELRHQKDKWDASIEAATKTGLLFYENGLDKPSSKDTFVKEFSQHLGDGLPDSTIEKIYKALPSGYKQSGGRPKKDAAIANIDNIIKAAAFAGTLHEAPERLKLANLKGDLNDAGINLPDDDMLKKIIDAVKKLDI